MPLTSAALNRGGPLPSAHITDYDPTRDSELADKVTSRNTVGLARAGTNFALTSRFGILGFRVPEAAGIAVHRARAMSRSRRLFLFGYLLGKGERSLWRLATCAASVVSVRCDPPVK